MTEPTNNEQEASPITWHDQTCSDCTFNVGNECRKDPPTLIVGVNGDMDGIESFHPTYYPDVCTNDVPMCACSHWVRSAEKRQERGDE